MESIFSYLANEFEEAYVESSGISPLVQKQEYTTSTKVNTSNLKSRTQAQHNPISVFSGVVAHSVYSLYCAAVEPTKLTRSRKTSIAIDFARRFTEFSDGTLSHVRAGIWAAALAIPYQIFGSFKVMSFAVNINELLTFENRGKTYASKTTFVRYPIPKDNSLVAAGGYYNIDAEWTAPRFSSKYKRKVILYIHGGAFVFGSATIYRVFTEAVANECGYPVFAFNYRLAPECPFPAALHDVLAAYLFLLNPNSTMFRTKSDNQVHKGYESEDIIIMGDSAGGNICVAFLNYLNHYLCDVTGKLMVPIPGAAVLISPWVDLTCASQSYLDNKEFDIVPFKLSNIHEPVTKSFEHPVYSYCFGYN
jgi:acetyl esterase/lipase